MTRCVIYCRISKDRVGAGLGVERQREECERLAEALGWEVVYVYEDNDLSAYSGKPRPGYLQMFADLKAGTATAVITWHTDRLHRSPAELEDWIKLCEKRGIVVRTVKAGEIDLSTPSGQMTARIVGAVARHEIDHARERMAAAHAQAAEKGSAHGRVPYGYRGERVNGKIVRRVPDENRVVDGEPHAGQAPIVREIAERVLAGESLYSIAKHLNEREVPTPGTSAVWRASIMKQMMVRPTYAGLRSHKGTVTPGDWEPLISAEDHAALLAILEDPNRKTHRGTEPKYLLSGIARCGIEGCGAVVWRLKSHGRSVYTCSNKRCVSRRIEDVDQLVEALFISEVSKPKFLESLAESSQSLGMSDSVKELRVLEQRLDKVATQVATGEMDDDFGARVVKKIREDMAAATARISSSAPNPALLRLAGPGAAERWTALPLAEKRGLIRDCLTVKIKPAGKGRRFDPNSVDAQWRKATVGATHE